MRAPSGVPGAYVASSGSVAPVAPVAPVAEVAGAAARGVDTGLGVAASSVTRDSVVRPGGPDLRPERPLAAGGRSAFGRGWRPAGAGGDRWVRARMTQDEGPVRLRR